MHVSAALVGVLTRLVGLGILTVLSVRGLGRR